MTVWSNKSIAKDLRDFARVLKSHQADILFDVDRLEELSCQIPELDYCEIEKFEIEFYGRKPLSGMYPEIRNFKISLSNSVSSNPDLSSSEIDPIKNFTFDLVIIGFCKHEVGKTFINCWHLDKNIKEQHDGEQKYTHPLYHFQFGGNRLNEMKTSGDILLMGAPRIPHPPMDLFLSIHFILNNYFNKKDSDYLYLNGLFADYEYRRILKNAKQRMWYPYFDALRSDHNTNNALNLASLFPLAV